MDHFNLVLRMAIFCLFLGFSPLIGQNSDIPLNHELYHYMDRLDIQGRVDTVVHTDVKPYSREFTEAIFGKTDLGGMTPKMKKWFHLNRIQADDNYADQQEKKGVFKALYTNGRDLYTVSKPNFRMYVNPMLYIDAGINQSTLRPNGGGLQETFLNYRNSRGAQVRGSLFEKVGFYTEVIENQAKLPWFVRNRYTETDRLFGESFIKIFDTNMPDGNFGFDYFSAKGYITYSPVKNFRIKLGKDRAFLGNGTQSLHLSDHATDYFFLNLNTRIWKLEYVNHFTQMVDYIRKKPDDYGTYPRKYAVFHQLLYKPVKTVSVGFFESIVYSPTLPGQRRGFELEYMNPIIFFRSVEQYVGSPDNSMMGLSAKVNFLKRFQGYGQIMLDDFNFRVRNQGTGYHGNKWGIQAGLKYIDAFWVPGLDLQMEYNVVRPYSFSHFNPTANYSHYGQTLAHPLGANFYDLHLVARYQPFPRWSGTLAFSKMKKGLDINGENYGGNIFLPYTTRIQDFNNTVTQGEVLDITQLHGRITYRILSLDAFAEVEGRYRRENDQSDVTILGTLRLNLPTKPVRF